MTGGGDRMTGDMTGAATAGLRTGIELLERAVAYTLGSLLLVEPTSLSNPTPCRDWDLRELLLHMNISMGILDRSIAFGSLDSDPQEDRFADYGGPSFDPVASLRNRACHLLGAWADARRTDNIRVADLSVPPLTVAVVGALEVAVHGWDVARSCRADRPLPDALAQDLLTLCPLLVGESNRPESFAPRVAVPEGASQSDVLIGYLGRIPADCPFP